jgi:hypothetical protein
VELEALPFLDSGSHPPHTLSGHVHPAGSALLLHMEV